MGNFNKSYNSLILKEGGYVNDPVDTGGETYKGVARNKHPDWQGWAIIDMERSIPTFPKSLDLNNDLQKAIALFYKAEFWDIFNCDNLPDSIADELFEVSVNTGVFKATKILQESLNLLNKDEKYYDNIDVDGLFGVETYATLGTYLQTLPEYRLYNVMNILQGEHYIELMRKKEVYEKYVGWFDRVEIKRKLNKW